MKLLGRIDRVDTVESEGKIFVKIVDYKSGNKKFDIAALYYGLQLQLVLYMNAAVEQEKRSTPEKRWYPPPCFTTMWRTTVWKRRRSSRKRKSTGKSGKSQGKRRHQ